MVSGLTRMGILVGIVSVAGRAASDQPIYPVPRWQAELTTPGTALQDSFTAFSTTPQLLLLQSASQQTIIAINRRDGKESWRRGSGSPSRGGNSWRLLGHAPTPTSGAVLLLRNSTQLEAVEETSGRVLWRKELPNIQRGVSPVHPSGVFGGVLVLAKGEGPLTHVTCRDAATGVLIDPQSELGQQALRKAIAQLGTPFIAVELADVQPYLLDLRSGRLRPIPDRDARSRTDRVYGHSDHLDYSAPEPVFLARDRLVALFDMDDDGAGHSGWPKYLLGTNLSGKPLWQFPRTITFADQYRQVAAPASRIQRAFHPSASRTVIARDAADRLYGVRLQDGSVAWRKQLPMLRLVDLAAAQHGFFLLANSEGPAGASAEHASLAHVDADTGRLRWLSRVPVATKLVTSGNDLYLLTSDRILAYRAPDLTARSRH